MPLLRQGPILLAALALAFASPAGAAPGPHRAGAWVDPDDSGPEVSSYGSLQTVIDDQPVPMPLQHTGVTAEVSGFVASVEVVQRFGNPYDRPIEATYVFPLPHGAAVHAFELEVGQRTIHGVVRRRAEAQEAYERAKSEGRTAALLDQERPNVFTQRVANVLPGEAILVRLRYVETLAYDRGAYEFVFPMVVGPRYVGGRPVGRTGAGWSPDTDRVPDASRITPRLLAEGLWPGNDIAVTVHIDAGLPLQNVFNPTHRVRIDRPSPTRASVELVEDDTVPNRDFIVRYEVAGRRPEAALLAHRDARGGHFLMMVQPEAAQPAAEVAPRDVVFVVDTSGSMSGFPLEKAADVVRTCLRGLREQDRFQLVRFASGASALFGRPVAPTADNVAQALGALADWQGEGGTEFLPALELALAPSSDPDRSRVVLFLTDGYIGYEAEVIRHVRAHLGDANLFALGVGSSVNRFLIDAMSRAGMAEPFYILNAESADAVVSRFAEYVSRPTLTSVEIDWGGLDVHDVTPTALPDLFAERPLFVVGRYERGGTATVTLRGRLAGRPWQEELEVTLPDGQFDEGHGAIPLLWARRRIADLMDRWRAAPDGDAAAEEAVTGLALQFQLMSRFTSFVAVDDRPSRSGGQPVEVPVLPPLPEDVSDRAAPPGAFAYGSLGVVGHGAGGGGGHGGGFGRVWGMGKIDTRARLSAPARGGTTSRFLGAAPKVKASVATVLGSASADDVRRVMRRSRAQLRRVYEQALKRSPGLAGRLVVRLVVGPDGKVRKAEVTNDTLHDARLARELLKVLRRLRFPKPAGGGELVVSYPFVFAPGG